MLGIGSTELVLILFFGFLIFGPEKLPEMGRTVGRAIRQFRTASDQASAKFKEEVYDPFQEAIDPYKTEIEKTVAPIKEDIDAINDSFSETKQAFTDPLGTKARKKEAQERKQELRNTLSFGSKKDDAAAGAAAKGRIGCFIRDVRSAGSKPEGNLGDRDQSDSLFKLNRRADHGVGIDHLADLGHGRAQQFIDVLTHFPYLPFV